MSGKTPTRPGLCDGSLVAPVQGYDNLRIGHKCPILVKVEMEGSEFIRKAQMLAKVRGLPWRLDEKRGKGSHVTL
jgi:hypothetical protein